jgi:hypothetical protein
MIRKREAIHVADEATVTLPEFNSLFYKKKVNINHEEFRMSAPKVHISTP